MNTLNERLIDLANRLRAECGPLSSEWVLLTNASATLAHNEVRIAELTAQADMVERVLKSASAGQEIQREAVAQLIRMADALERIAAYLHTLMSLPKVQ